MNSESGSIMSGKGDVSRRRADDRTGAVSIADDRQAPPAPAHEPSSRDQTTSQDRDLRFRFTSNVVAQLVTVVDVLCFMVSAPIAYFAFDLVRSAEIVISVHALAFLLMLSTFLLVRSSRHATRRGLLEPNEGLGDLASDAVLSSLVASALIWQAGLIDDYSRGFTLLFLAAVILCLWVSRPALSWVIGALARRGHIQQRIAFYGADTQSVALAKQLVDSLKMDHVRFVGVVDDRAVAGTLDGLPVLGGLEQLCEMAKRGGIDQVLINGSHLGRARINEIVEELSSVCVDISLIPRDAIELAPNYKVNLLGSTPVLTLWQRPFRDINQVVKRLEDLVLGSIVLILVSPILALGALLVRLSSPGPIFFVQPRVGFNNEVIQVLKFRTMFVHLSDVGAVQTTTRHDPRVTPIGWYLRKLSIDELPQLLNVFRGDMSLVGPRPHAIEMKVGDLYYQDAVRGYAGRHRVKPGITGLAQVKGLRGEVRTVERAKRRVELDKEYVERWSLWFDLKIMFLTVRAVLFDRDAY